MRLGIVVLILCAMCSCAWGESVTNATMSDVISGKVFPLSVKVGELTPDWRVMSITGARPGTQLESNPYIALMTEYRGLTTNVNDLYTRGDTVILAGETYMAVYRLRTQPIDLAALEDMRRSQMLPKEKMTPDTPLLLALVNLRNIDGMYDIRPVDTKEILAANAKIDEMAKTAEEREQASESMNHLKELATAAQFYWNDYDGKLPPMSNPAEVKKALYNYAKNKDIFIQPGTDKPYLPNTTLSNHKESQISEPTDMVLFYEAAPAPDGSRNVAFMDSHVKRVSAEEWKKLKAACKIKS